MKMLLQMITHSHSQLPILHQAVVEVALAEAFDYEEAEVPQIHQAIKTLRQIPILKQQIPLLIHQFLQTFLPIYTLQKTPIPEILFATSLKTKVFSQNSNKHIHNHPVISQKNDTKTLVKPKIQSHTTENVNSVLTSTHSISSKIISSVNDS